MFKSKALRKFWKPCTFKVRNKEKGHILQF